MPIERDSHDNIMITGDSIDLYRLLALRRALKLEIEHGLKVTKGSILALLRREGLTSKNTKRGAYVDLDSIISDCGGKTVPLTPKAGE